MCAQSCVCFDIVLAGAPLYDDGDASTLWKGCYESNEMLIGSLRVDEHEAALHELALNDYKSGRMSKPQEVNWNDMAKVKLVPRFAVEQGVKPDGSVKIRAVDHFSWSSPDTATAGKERTRKEVKAHSLDGHYTVTNDLSHDHLDVLMEATRLYFATLGSVSHCW